jgi:hypothetical protein
MKMLPLHRVLHLFGWSDAWMPMEWEGNVLTVCGRCGHRR